MLEAFQLYKDAGLVGNMQRRVDNNWIDHLGVYFLPDGLPLHIGQNKSWAPLHRYRPAAWSAPSSSTILADLAKRITMDLKTPIFASG